MKTFEQKVQDAMDEACLPPQLYENGVVAAIQDRINDAFEEELTKLKQAHAVIVNMRRGTTAKIDFRQWAWTHGINDNGLIDKVQKILGEHLDKK